MGEGTRESLMTVEAALFGAIILHEMHSHSLCGVIVTMHEVTQVVCGAEPHKSDDQLHKYGISYSNSKQCLLASGYDLKLCLTSEECLCLSLWWLTSFLFNPPRSSRYSSSSSSFKDRDLGASINDVHKNFGFFDTANFCYKIQATSHTMSAFL